MTSMPPTCGVPVAKVVSYTKEYIDPKRLIGAECHQTKFNGLSRDFYTYHLTKNEKKKYWKQVSNILDTSKYYHYEEFKNIKDKKKRSIPIYYNYLSYVNAWERFNPFIDIVVGVKVY